MRFPADQSAPTQHDSTNRSELPPSVAHFYGFVVIRTSTSVVAAAVYLDTEFKRWNFVRFESLME